MSTVTSTSIITNGEGRLHSLADIALSRTPVEKRRNSDTFDEAAGLLHLSPTARTFPVVSHPIRAIGSLHIPCDQLSPAPSQPKPLKRSRTSNSLPTPSTSSGGPQKTKPKAKTRHSARSKAAAKSSLERKFKRLEVKERALKIKTVENSPVNQQQLLVLRMVFDQITMYPTETWMALLAIIIRRAFKQVKIWFSNQRPKHKQDADVVRMVSPDNERLRLRPVAIEFCRAEEWSDSFFEEVVMVHNFKILSKLRRDEIRRLTTERDDV